MKRKQVQLGRQTRDGRWYVNRSEDGRRRRTFYRTKREAEAEAARIRGELAAFGDASLGLSPFERTDLLHFRQECLSHGINWWDLLREYRDGRIVVRAAAPPLCQVIEELVRSKDGSGRSHRYTQTLRIILDGFARGRDRIPISRVTSAEIEAWLASRNLASRPTLRARLSTLFRFAMRRGYIGSNPCERIEPVRLVRRPPTIFTVRQMAVALVWMRRRAPRALAWFVLSALCGLRPEEAERTAWNAIVEEADGLHVRVEAQTSKVRQRRIVTPLPAAAWWLRHARQIGSELPISSQARRYACRRLARRLGWKDWPKDVTRHTAASYWLSQVNDAAHVAEQLGHTVAELKASYRALVPRSDAERFWRLIPRTARHHEA